MADNAQSPIVGIGASAGGIEALETLFGAVPIDIGAGFVIVTHLSPDRPSLLPEIMQRFTALPVVTVEDGMKVERDRVYVMPENVTMTIQGGLLKLTRPRGPKHEIHPVDVFMSSLAADQGETAVGIILSGADGDGTLGIKAIKERGGLTMAQTADGTPPRYESMPQTAIASGMIDLAIPAQEMGSKIRDFVGGQNVFDRLKNGAQEGEDRLQDEFRDSICALLKKQVGHDFSGYKIKTFTRRILRRMQLMQLPRYEDYVARLRSDPSEVASLFRDLLISVTNFFRDAEAFQTLADSALPEIFEGKGDGDTIRIWVPGCATGEEVYSIGILVREHLDTLAVRPRVQIFATDIDERSLDAARLGRYPEQLLESVTPERRRRFFTREGSSYVVSKNVRELCTFSPHSLIRDPPFSRMDLVSCRNLLIYMDTGLQGQVIPLFHYSLRPQGFLFLGSSETVSQFGELFAPVDKKHRLFRARESDGPTVKLPMLVRKGVTEQDTGRGTRVSVVQSLRQDIDSRVMDRYAPAHVVINAENDIVFYSNRTGKYLEQAAGVPSRQLLAMARKGLRLELRAAIRDAISSNRRADRHNISLETDDGRLQVVAITVEPLDLATDEPYFIVLFFDIGPPIDRDHAVVRVVGDQGKEVTALDRELRDTRERLQSTAEEYETALEELKSTNEEVVSVNEELQSTNEELEASKEELQSLNEELQTVNAELSHKIDELDQSNNDLRNLFETSRIATVFVNTDLTIRNFTPLAGELFSLVPSDRGRSLTIFSNRLIYPEFIDDLTRTTQSKEAVDTKVLHDDGTTKFLVRIQPYKSADGEHVGATVTFVDVSGSQM